MRPLFIIPFLFLTTLALAQSPVIPGQIQGHVVDSEKGTPLTFANVLLANTTRGTRTDESGAFHIRDLSPGHYRMIVSYMGYDTQVIEVNTANAVSYKVLLKPGLKELKEVVFRAKTLSRSEWVNYFKMFKEHFIGLSDNYRFCTVENPRVLDFYEKDKIFTAVADSVLVIENRGLGYRISLFLEKYEHNILRYRTHYEQQIIFEPLEPKNEKEKKEWAEARLKAYYGSEMHFFRTLYKRDLYNEGYSFNIIVDHNFGKDGGIQRVGWADSTKSPRAAIYDYKRFKIHTLTNYNKVLDSLSTPGAPVLKFQGEMRIDYINEAESYNYQTSRDRGFGKKPQISHVRLLKPGAVIQPNGQIYPPDAVETSGYWSWELMAEALPLDYEPDDDIRLTGFRILTQEELKKNFHD